MPKISVIMGVHNGEKTLPRAIDSILNQTLADFELIICDDCSTDATIKVIKSYTEKDNRVILTRNESNCGLASSLNNCINISKGEYIARMDDDDISHADRFEKQNNFLDKHQEYAIVGTCRNTFDNAGIWNTYGQGGELTKEDIIKCNIFTHPTVMMRKEALVSAGMYTVCERTMRGQDFDLWCKMYFLLITVYTHHTVHHDDIEHYAHKIDFQKEQLVHFHIPLINQQPLMNRFQNIL